MRILLCLNRDLMSNRALNLLAKGLQQHEVHIVLSSGIGNGKKPSSPALRFLEQEFINQYLFPCIEAEKVQGRFQTFNQLADSFHTTIKEFPNINADNGINYVASLKPDVMVSIRFGQIFRQPIIDIPPKGIINLHSGILPDYRGVLATFRALYEGKQEYGCTLHYIRDKTIDTGDIIGIHRLPVDKDKSLLTHVAALYEGGTAMIEDTLKKMERGEHISTIHQDREVGSYHSAPTATDIEAFTAKGFTLYTPKEYRALLENFPQTQVNGAIAAAASPLLPLDEKKFTESLQISARRENAVSSLRRQTENATWLQTIQSPANNELSSEAHTPGLSKTGKAR